MDIYRRIEQLAINSVDRRACPSADDLAAYIIGEIRGEDQLRVAAHVRTCPFCQEEEILFRPPLPRQPFRLARLIPMAVAGVRSSNTSLGHRHYAIGEQSVDLLVPTADGETWRLSGRVQRAQHPIPSATVTLRSGRRIYRQTTDDAGFFLITGILSGRYTLWIEGDGFAVQIRNLRFPTND